MNGAPSGRTRYHCAACAHAVSMTQRPSGVMAPLDSAGSMNASGASTPSVGWSQRSSASTPRSSPPGRATIGWYTTVNSPASRADRIEVVRAIRALSVACWAAS